MSNYTSADVPESSRVVIDPVTRIEGHLRVEMEAGDGVIKNAWTSTTQYRGIEVIACKRDPRDVWAFCGTHLRRLHGYARHRGPGCGGRRAPVPGARPGPPHARPGQRSPGHPGPRHPFLPAPGHGLGGRDVRPEGGPRGNRRHRQVPFRLAPVLRRVFRRSAEEAEGTPSPTGNIPSLRTATGAIRPTSCRRR